MTLRGILLFGGLLLVTAGCTAGATDSIAGGRGGTPEGLEESTVGTADDGQTVGLASPNATGTLEATWPIVTMTPPSLPDLGPAPEWNNGTWINSDWPLPLTELRGKVVLLEFWTFG